jgi:hypothetical protein
MYNYSALLHLGLAIITPIIIYWVFLDKEDVSQRKDPNDDNN